MHALLDQLYDDMVHDVDPTHVATTAAEAFALKRGVCQDLSHIFIAAARGLGVPARYISGYFRRTDTTDQDAGHAWAGAYVPDLGWVAFDPANGMCATDAYVRVAVGLDYLITAPPPCGAPATAAAAKRWRSRSLSIRPRAKCRTGPGGARRVPRTRVHFDRDVREHRKFRQPTLIGSGWLWWFSNNGCSQPDVTRAKPPQMQVGDAVAVRLQPLANGVCERLAWDDVEEHSTRRAHRAQRPLGDDKRTDDTDRGIQPVPTEHPSSQQRDNGEHRGDRVGKDMEVGRAEIAVMAMSMLMRLGVGLVMLLVEQQPGAREGDREADAGNQDRFVERDRYRVHEAGKQFHADEQRNEGQYNGAGEPGQLADLASAIGKAWIAGVSPCIAIGEHGDRERRDMGRHVPAVGGQRHRSESRAGDDFGHHHDPGENHYQAGPVLVTVMFIAKKIVGVLPRVDGMTMHFASPARAEPQSQGAIAAWVKASL